MKAHAKAHAQAQERVPDAAARASEFAWHPANEAREGVLYPILHQDIWDLRNSIQGAHWTANEVSLAADARDWKQMAPGWRRAVKYQLAFFATIDVDVLSNIDRKFIEEVDCLEAEFLYAAQADQECVHAESYANQIAALLDGAEREETFRAVRTLPAVGKMRDWVVRWSSAERPIAERLVAFAAVEGVLFCASFCVLQWLREYNILPGVTTYNDFIARDEWTHTQFSCLLVREYVKNKPSESIAHEIMESIGLVIDEFVAETFGQNTLPGISAESLQRYVKFQADSVLSLMGYGPRWHETNPFAFMDKLAMNRGSKTNFFERKVTHYQGVQAPSQAEFALAAADDSD